MTKIQVMGPTKKNAGPVTLQKTYTRSPTSRESQFMVKIKLGPALRQVSDSSASTSPQPQGITTRNSYRATPTYNGLPARNRFSEMYGETESLRHSSHGTPIQLWPDALSPGQNSEGLSETPNNPSSDHNELPIRKSSLAEHYSAPFAKPPDHIAFKVSKLVNPDDNKDDAESDIEILEVRNVPSLRPQNSSSSDNTYHSNEGDTDSDLSCLQEEIDFALSSATTRTSELASSPPKNPTNTVPVFKLLPSMLRLVQPRSPPPPGFRNIPPNLVHAIQRELHFFSDQNNDDDVEVIGKMAFSLKDPIARTKIKLPIKATTCRHFECFDFNNFCLFYGLPPGIKHGLKSSMLMQSKQSRETEAIFYKQQSQIAEGKMLLKSPGLVFPQFSEHGQMFFTDVYCRTPPLYKCPLCDEKFGLKQLYISDIFNFFVKTTPAHITRIELVENDRYKIIEEETIEKSEEKHDVVDLDDDDDSTEQDEVNHEIDVKSLKTNGSEIIRMSMTADDFNDGLDDVLLGLKQGDGSWHHPLTLD